jgi:MFS transporter, FHS family, L-fucose permease
MGVFVLAAGLTFLETVANPYTTVLGPAEYAASRINLAQSCNGVGWIFGPVIGGIFFYSAGGVDASSERIYIPYAAVACVVLILAVVFYFASIPDINTEDAYRLDEGTAGPSRSIWSHPHFVFAVVAQFLYVAAQAGVFSFFINYMVEEIPSLPEKLANMWLLEGGSELRNGAWFLNEKGAARLLGYVGFVLFLIGRFSGAAILKQFAPHRVFGLYAAANVVMMLLVFLKLGWLSVVALFLSFFFMSIMFPTIFALGIYGLGKRAKVASSFIVMAIMGGAIMPKLMGWIADHTNMSRGFIVPLFCFVVLAVYGFGWRRLSGAGPGGNAAAPAMTGH